MERHNWHLMLNIDKHTTSYNIYCPYFFIRSILNIICDSLNTLCCSFLITRSGFVIMRCRSYTWCSSLIITCCAFINCRATCYFMYSRYNIIRSTPFIIRCSKFTSWLLKEAKFGRLPLLETTISSLSSARCAPF